MPRILSPEEVHALGLEQEQPQGGRVLSPEEVAHLGLDDEQPGAWQAAGEGALQGATLGFEDEIEGGVKALAKKAFHTTEKSLVDQYREDRDHARERAARAQAAHPMAFGAGQIGGGVLTAALAPELGLGRGILGAARAGAVYGAAGGLGDSQADLTKGDVQGAVADTLHGAAAGAATGGALGAAAEAAPAIGRKLGEAGNNLAARTLKGTAHDYRKLGPGGPAELGEWLLDKGAVKFGSSPEAVAERVADLKASTGKNLGDAISDLDASGAPGVSRFGLATDLLDAADQAAQRGPGTKSLVNRLRQAAADIANEPGPDRLDFAKAEQWKRAYQDEVNYGRKNPGAGARGDQEVASTVRQGVEDAAERQVSPDLSDAFLAAKKESSMAKKAAGITEEAEGRRQAANVISPSAQGVQIGGTIAALASGHPAAAIPAMLSGVAYQAAKRRGPAALAVAARGTGDLLKKIVVSNPGALGKYGAVLANAYRSGGDQGLAAHSYVLSQTDPQFQQLTSTLGNDGKE